MISRAVRTSRFALQATLILVLAALLTACGTTSHPATATGTLIGDVVAGPTCPVEQVGNPCPPRPVAGREVAIVDAEGHVVATTTTDERGHFSLTLSPGAYTVRVAIVPGEVGMRQVTPGQVTIATGETVNVTIVLDTGIR